MSNLFLAPLVPTQQR